jgi:CRISPR-associated protein Cas1
MHLSGYGVKIRTRSLTARSELEITDGREDDKVESVISFRPRRFPYDSIIIDGHSGYISLQGLHWLSRNKVPVFVLNYDGSLISSILPPMPIKADLRAAQIKAASDTQKKSIIAKALVQAKIARSLQVLDWLSERHDLGRDVQLATRDASRLDRATTVRDVRSIEGRAALRYWEAFRKTIPESFDFHGRMTTTHQNNASDPVNLALNYAYGVLEGECRRAINGVGLESAVGFLHDFSGYQTKQSLVYDLMEPFRWLADVSVIQAIEAGALDLPDFYFRGDDYRYRFGVDAKQRFIDLLREQFNSGVSYEGCVLKWDTVIERKTIELSRYLIGRSRLVQFIEPSPILKKTDNSELRNRILSMSTHDARRRGIGKSTLHYLRRNARARSSLTVYEPVRRKLRRLI